jgi:MtN3 and saliva related transmembrane protein
MTVANLDVIEAIGLVAAFLTTLSFLPQAILILRTRNTDGISLLMYVLFTSGVFLWVVYGMLIMSWPLILANTVTFAFAGLILTAKLLSLRPSKPPSGQ